MSRTRGTPSTVARWATRTRKGVRDGDVLELVVEGLGDRQIVQRWDDASAALEQPDAWGQEVIDAAQDHADQGDTATRYRLELRRDDAAWSSFTLKLIPSDLSPTDTPDAPDYTALLSQQMRHTEKLHQMIIGLVSAQTKGMEAMATQNALMMQDRTAMLERERALMLQQVHSESHIEAEEWRIEREKRLMEKGEQAFNMMAPELFKAMKAGFAKAAAANERPVAEVAKLVPQTEKKAG